MRGKSLKGTGGEQRSRNRRCNQEAGHLGRLFRSFIQGIGLEESNGKINRLEWEKYETGKYIRNAAILIVLLVIFNYAMTFLGIANDPDTGVPDMAFSNMGVSTNVELLTDITFLIFAAAMHATFIIGAYKNKTMNLMFLYPLNRKKIMAAKMLAVCIFCFAGIVIAKLACYGVSNLGFMMGREGILPDGRQYSKRLPSEIQIAYKVCCHHSALSAQGRC
ncbi:MAG: ABC transporter permease [[Clostridium] scindens]